MAPKHEPQHYVHLVGSIPLSSTEEVFRTLSAALPTQLKAIPDGEVADRNRFVGWQRAVVGGPSGVMLKKMAPQAHSYDMWHASSATVTPAEAKAAVDALPPLETGYDTEALKSYEVFKTLQAQGVIPKGIRFQVCLPTPTNPVGMLVELAYKPFIERVYTEALLRAVRNIQNQIPNEHLAIQIDVCAEFALLEGVGRGWIEPWFPVTISEVAARIVRMMDAVDNGVTCGAHLCYGDAFKKHFIEPKDTGLMVDVALAVMEQSKRKLSYIHMPVPKDRKDEAYFEPLKRLMPKLEEQGTDLVLGLVHAYDEQGTKERMAVVKSVVGERFAIATECGMGRIDAREEFDSVLEISAKVSEGI